MAKLILLNKPFQVMPQFTDEQGRTTLANYVTTKGVYAAGRLDYDSEGLMLLTDNGQLQHQIANPKKKMTKRYWVQVEGDVDDVRLNELRKGIVLKDGPCRPAKVEIIQEPKNLWPRTPPIRERASIPTTWLSISISEGRNRQVRRMTAAIGYPTLRLIRYSIGDWALESLAPGDTKLLEVNMPAPRKPVHRRRPNQRSSGGTKRR